LIDEKSLNYDKEVCRFLVVVVIERVFMKNSDSGILCEVRCDERPVQVQVEREKNEVAIT
jgi:hypothetical protein